MLNSMHGVKLYALCCTRSEALCFLLYMELSFMLIATHEVKRSALCYTWIEALCSLQYMK